MKGRLENELKMRKQIENILQDMPDYVTDFYYNIKIDTSATTCINYLGKIRDMLRFFEGKDIGEINSSMIARYFDSKSYTTASNGEVKKTSGSYKQGLWTTLNAFFIYLYDRKLIDENPMKTIKRPKKNDIKKESILTQDDLKKMREIPERGITYKNWHNAENYHDKWKERDAAILMIFICTGIRKTALSEINFADVSFENMTITSTDKRDKTRVDIMTSEMADIMQKWITKREKLLGETKCDALFITDKKQRICGKTVYRIVQRYTKETVGVPLSPHKLRGAFCEGTYEANGHDLEATRIAMGHESVMTTSIYIKNRNDARENAITSMANFIYKDSEEQ